MKDEIILFETKDRSITLPVQVTADTVWLNRSQLAELFGRDIKTIGKHILGVYQDKLVMHYALQNITNQVFVSRYQLYLPNREQLESEFRRFMRSEEETE